MKIAVADNTGFKFTSDLTEAWVKAGHEVRREPGASEHLAQWADVYYVDFWDNNIHYLWKLYNGDEDHNRTPDWDNNKKPIIVCRAIDWEVWIGFARDQRIIDWVDKSICIAPHIEKKLRAENDWKNLKLIRPGVNLEKFTLKTKETDGYQVGMVLGDMWWYKNHMGGLDIFKTLVDRNPDKPWHMHIRGQHEGGDYNPVMFNEYLKSRHLENRVTLYPKNDNMNEWYENIDVLLHPGMKETFTYAVAEALTKGIPAIVNNFYGSEEVWPNDMRYYTHDEAVKYLENLRIINPEVPSLPARQIIEEKYSLEQMIKEINDWVGIR
jgi:glycosyltransferase involved in cell wall biosynthesis